MKKSRFAIMRSVKNKVIALFAALAVTVGCFASLTFSAGADTTAPEHWHSTRNGCTWTYSGAYSDGNGQWADWNPKEEMWVGNEDSDYTDYVNHNAVSRWGDVNHDTVGDVQDALILFLAASGKIEENATWYDNFLRPSAEYFVSHPYEKVLSADGAMYNAMVVYSRLCAGEEYDREIPAASTTTTTTIIPTITTVPTSESATDEIVPDFAIRTKVMSEIDTVEEHEQFNELIIYYINQLRKAEGTPPAKHLRLIDEVAQYRSIQLVTNFAHDQEDMKEAAEYFKYGAEIIPDEFNSYYTTIVDEKTGEVTVVEITEPTYTFPGREAISLDTIVDQSKCDDIAYEIAEGFYESKEHWEYVGYYPYISIGSTYTLDKPLPIPDGISSYSGGAYISIIMNTVDANGYCSELGKQYQGYL